MGEALTERQREVLRVLVGAYVEHGRPASIRDVATRLGVAVNAVVGHVTALLKKGRVRYAGDAVISRGLLVVGLDEQIRAAARGYLADLG